MASIPKSKAARKEKAAPEKEETFSLISHEKLLAIYAAMVKCRMVEQRAATLFQQGRLASDLHASAGHEATAAAVAIDLLPADSLSLSNGEWLPAFVKGMTLESVFRALAPASARPEGPGALEQMHILPLSDKGIDPSSVRDKAEDAKAAKQQSIVAVMLPSSELSLKPWHDVLMSAASQRLPIVFVHYAEGPQDVGAAQSDRNGKNPTALFHGVPAITVDALDAVAVYRVAYEAIMRARSGRGATLLECVKLPEVVIPGNAKQNGASSDLPRWSDPVATMETYLRSKGIEPAPHNQEIVAAFNHELDLATRFLEP